MKELQESKKGKNWLCHIVVIGRAAAGVVNFLYD